MKGVGKLGVALAVLATSLAACSSSGSADGPGSGSASAVANSNVDALVKLALDYTGGTAGAADTSKSPIVLGWVNQFGGQVSFPDATNGAQAAVKFINAELGGVNGHPLQLKVCNVATEEDGLKCGIQMGNDPAVKIVLTGLLTIGNQGLYSALGAKKPIIISSPSTAPDFANKNAVAFTSGAAGQVGSGAKFITEMTPKPKSVSIIVADIPSNRAIATGMVEPVLQSGGVTDVRIVAVPAQPSAPDMASALQAAGKADVVDIIQPTQGCIAAYDALKSLGWSPQVVAVGPCYGTAMVQHLNGSLPDGWYFTSNGYSIYLNGTDSVPLSKAVDVMQYAIPKYAADPSTTLHGFGPLMFANIITAAKLVNKAGVDATTAALVSTLRSFAGPMWFVAGPMHCGANPQQPSICGSRGGVEQFKDGEWKAIDDGYTTNNEGISPFGN